MSGNVCRFFLTNNCRYGDRCRYSHNVSERSYSPTSNPYVYVRDEPKHSGSGGNYKQSLSNSEVREIVERIAEEAKQVEFENMWPLTCLSVLKDYGNVPGWMDFSMEEIRAAAYATKAGGRFHEYLQFYNSLKQKARENREIFLNHTRKAEEVVRGMFELKKREPAETQAQRNSSSNAFGNPFFGNSASGTTAPFGSGPSIFGGTSSTPNQAISFGSVSTDPAPGIFAMAARGFNQSPFFQNPVQQSDSMNETEMETATDITQSTAESPFHQNIFGQIPQQKPTPSVFQTQGAPPSSTPAPTISGSVSAIYTPLNALSPMDLEQFKATTFTLETLPLVPPPREYC